MKHRPICPRTCSTLVPLCSAYFGPPELLMAKKAHFWPFSAPLKPTEGKIWMAKRSQPTGPYVPLLVPPLFHFVPPIWGLQSCLWPKMCLSCLVPCLCLCLCLFVGHVMFSHDPHQFCEVGVWSGRLECFESNTISEWVSDQGRPRAARAAKNKNPFSVFLGPQIMKKKCDHCLIIIYIHFENNRNCFWSPKNKKSDLYGNMPYKRTVPGRKRQLCCLKPIFLQLASDLQFWTFW